MRWRVRELAALGLLLGALAVFSLFAIMTRRPEHPFFHRLERLPVAGPLVELVRLPYRARSVPRGPRGEPLRRDVVVVLPADRPENAPAPDALFVGGGAVLRAAPRSDAAVVLRTVTIGHFLVVERRAPWVLLRARGGTLGWLDESAPRALQPLLGEAPLPPGPLPERPADEERLRLAASAMDRRVHTGSLGPYSLRADFEDPSLFFYLERALAPLEGIYRQRTGRTPVGVPAAVIFFFSGRERYAAYASRWRELRGLDSPGHSSPGMIVLVREGQGPVDLELTLLHEVTHLLNRRALGPALPPWLDEGLAEELSELGIGLARGAELERWLLRFRSPTSAGFEQRGALAGLELVVRALRAGELPSLERLLALDRGGFVNDAAARNYAHAGYLIHYLLTGRGGALAPGWRAFLEDVALGVPPGQDRLEGRLGVRLVELEPELQAWLLDLAARVGVAPPSSGSAQRLPAGSGTRLSSSRQHSSPSR